MRKFLISVALLRPPRSPRLFRLRPSIAAPRPRRSSRRMESRRPDSRQAINELLRDLSRAENGIERSVQRRIISQREAFGLRREANQIRVQLNRASRNGISGREFASLRVQVNRLEQRLRIERRDRDGRRY